MKQVIMELVNIAKQEACLEYARVELERNLQRKIRSSTHPASQYFLSTENKLSLIHL